MNQIITRGIVLSRTDFGEADRIVKFLTPDHGKVSVIAKGVRKSKSKLAGSIELFSISEITYIVGKGEVYTLISARLKKHYENIVKDLARTNLGYEFINLLNKATAEKPEDAYFKLLDSGFGALDKEELNPEVIEPWFYMQLLKLAGHTPNLRVDTQGKKLSENEMYDFDIERMRFIAKAKQGSFSPSHIKFLRLGFSGHEPEILSRVQGLKSLIRDLQPFLKGVVKSYY